MRSTPAIRNNRHWNYQNEMSSYFKDDWKFRYDLTLNLGIHWEWYGQPYEHNGLAARVVGDAKLISRTVRAPVTPGRTRFQQAAPIWHRSSLSERIQRIPRLAPMSRQRQEQFCTFGRFRLECSMVRKRQNRYPSGYGISYEGAFRNFITVDGVIGTVPGINLVSRVVRGLLILRQTYTSLATRVTCRFRSRRERPRRAPFPVTTTTRNLRNHRVRPRFSVHPKLEFRNPA